jgi:hypothetical protein
MMWNKMTTASSRITKIGGGYPPSQSVCYTKTAPLSCFSCKTDILWVVSFLQNRSEVDLKRLSKEVSIKFRLLSICLIVDYL